MATRFKNVLCTHYLYGKCKFTSTGCNKEHAIDIPSAKAEFDIKKTTDICSNPGDHDMNECRKLHLNTDLSQISDLFVDNELKFISFKYNEMLMIYNKTAGDERITMLEEITGIRDHIIELKQLLSCSQLHD